MDTNPVGAVIKRHGSPTVGGDIAGEHIVLDFEAGFCPPVVQPCSSGRGIPLEDVFLDQGAVIVQFQASTGIARGCSKVLLIRTPGVRKFGSPTIISGTVAFKGVVEDFAVAVIQSKSAAVVIGFVIGKSISAIWAVLTAK